MEFTICYCRSRPIKRADRKSWVHVAPLAELVVTRQEAAAVAADPPRGAAVLHRPTVLHHAAP